MRLRSPARLRRAALAVAAGLGAAVLVAPATASAAINDNFAASTSNGCAVANFIDYGPGAPGGGNNDDYVVIHDYCADGHGVRAYVWINTLHWGSQYNGNGLAGAAVVWDPFRTYYPDGNLIGGDYVVLKVCLVDGAGDLSEARCRTATHTMADG